MSKESLAQTLFNNGDVQKVTDDVFVCHGSNGNQYEIKRETNPNYNYEFYCKCPAWKFDPSRQCKHVIAVQLLENAKPTKQKKGSISIVKKGKVVRKQTVNNNYTKKKRTKADLKSENTTEWTEPDGSKTEFKFDSEGNLIGRVAKKK